MVKTENEVPVDSKASRGKMVNLDLLAKTVSPAPKDPKVLEASRDLPVNEALKGNEAPRARQAGTHHPPYTFMVWAR